MRKIKCFKNPSLSVVKLHQLNQSYMLSGSIVKEDEQKRINTEATSDFPFRHILHAAFNKTVITVPWVIIDGVKYKAEKCLVMTNFINTKPSFALHFRIIYMEESPIFVCKSLTRCSMICISIRFNTNSWHYTFGCANV